MNATPIRLLDARRSPDGHCGHDRPEVLIFPGVLHGYMMPDAVKAYHQASRDFTMQRALSILEGLRA